MRHSTAHVMAAAVCRLYKNVKLDIGPCVADGFYYDFDIPERVSPEDFNRIEDEMRKIVKENQSFERLVVSRAEAESLLSKLGQSFKLERLRDIPADEEITLYRCGDFTDLCSGPHVASTGELQSFKLTSVAGSYFRGVETNPMLQRLYGIAAGSDVELKAIVDRIEEAKKRDHRKLGKELDLFSVEEGVGPGLIHWHPRGARVRSTIEDFWKREHFRGGYELMYTPHIGRSSLWETSGHLEFYRENMYAHMDVDGAEYFVKPMNCPFHIQIFKNHKHSYRDLPLRWAELGTVYRYEKSGVLFGLLRVRGFTQDDAHIFCTPDQVVEEIRRTVRFATRILSSFGFNQFSAYLATRPEKAVGEESRWAQATESLENALKTEGIPYEVDEGGGAFYGPKIDIKIKDALGREWQLSTIQFDFNLPERFDLTFVGDDGKEHRPYMVHRALLGSLERFFGILIEHYAGAFPVWLAPEQVLILPLTENELERAQSIADGLRASDYRVTIDQKSDRIGAKIRRGQMMKAPYMLVLGPKEVAANQVSVRALHGGDLGLMSLESFVDRLRSENVPSVPVNVK
jgi:threonyl-tRNA synthetase